MKNIILYLLSIVMITILIYFSKSYLNNTSIESNNEADLNHSPYIRAEIEILNGCGEAGAANLFTRFLRSEGYDVIDIRNADNFKYKNTIVLFHKMDAEDKAKELSEVLDISESTIKFNNSSIWDLSLIIGKDYKELESFEKVKKFYELF